jgi:predicted alpha-1,6-mannanase (GH76 family)
MRLLVLSSCVIAAAVACSDDPASAPAAPIDPPADGGAPDVSSGPDAGPDAAPDAGPDARPAHDAADAAFEAMMLSFWDGGRGYLRSERPQASALTGYWIFAQAFDATLDSVARTGGRYRGLIETFYLAQDAVGWSRDFFDDENWMALALLRAYDLTGRAKYLARAKELFADIMTNADDASCCIASAPGGLWWDRPHTQKATAANAGPVVTAVRLWQRTNDTTYLDFARRVWAYWDAHMVDPASHRVFDHVKPGGEIVNYRFTYNEGVMIAASVALHEATKDPKVLAEAHAIAGWMIANETKATALGPVLHDGDDASCTGDCPQFKGIGYRGLAALHAADPRPEYAKVLDATAESLRTVARDPASGLFGVDWTKAPGKLVVESATSASMALSIHAGAIGPYGKALSTQTFEAEEGVLHAVGLEAQQKGFTGWGYVAGWNGDGQWVDFEVKAAPGAYDLVFRYAAGAGDASRLVHVNGVDVAADVPFPSTGGWGTYATVRVPVTLAAENTVSLVFNGGKGSKSYLNLDALTIEKK